MNLRSQRTSVVSSSRCSGRYTSFIVHARRTLGQRAGSSKEEPGEESNGKHLGGMEGRDAGKVKEEG